MKRSSARWPAGFIQKTTMLCLMRLWTDQDQAGKALTNFLIPFGFFEPFCYHSAIKYFLLSTTMVLRSTPPGCPYFCHAGRALRPPLPIPLWRFLSCCRILSHFFISSTLRQACPHWFYTSLWGYFTLLVVVVFVILSTNEFWIPPLRYTVVC